MEQELQQNLRQYAWNYVSFYGGQRARLLRLFVAIGSGLALGAAGLLRTEATEIVVAPLGGVLMILGALFWIMNRGLSAKVRHGEAALRHLDAELKLPNLKGGGAHVLRLLEQGDADGEGANRCCGCDESAIGSVVYLLFALLGFFFAMAPYYPNEMLVGPFAMATPAPVVKATPHRALPFSRPTPPDFSRRYPGNTPPPGFPNRPNGLPGRPPFGAQQPGVPAGAPPARFAPPTGAVPAGAAPPAGLPNGALQPGKAPGMVQPSRPAISPAVPSAAAPAVPAVPAPSAAAPAVPAPAAGGNPPAAGSPSKPPSGNP